MAFYEYECKKCGKQFTAEQSFQEHERHPKPKCPECQSRRVSQLLSEVHVQTSKKS